jgi:hypothetical protein
MIGGLRGIRRDGVTEAASKRRKAGVVRYERRHITDKDWLILERAPVLAMPSSKKFDRWLPPDP